MENVIKSVVSIMFMCMFVLFAFEFESTYTQINEAKQFQSSMVQKLKIAKLAESTQKECKLESANKYGANSLEIKQINESEYEITLIYKINSGLAKKDKTYKQKSILTKMEL